MVKDSAAMAADAIDIHTHIVPARFPPYLGDAAAARWPEMTPAHDCRHANVVIAGKCSARLPTNAGTLIAASRR
jgi:hypothetical protein